MLLHWHPLSVLVHLCLQKARDGSDGLRRNRYCKRREHLMAKRHTPLANTHSKHTGTHVEQPTITKQTA